MRLHLTLALLFSLPAFAQAKDPALKTEEQKTLYSLGAALGKNVETFALTSKEADYVVLGLKDSLKGKKLKVDLTAYQPRISKLAQERHKVRVDEEKKKAQEYLDKAAKEKGAKRLPSGLVFQEMKAGKGDSPKDTDTVKVHYHGTLTDGSVFDSSVERDSPSTFPLNRVIPCWTEGVQKIKVGGKAKLLCPSDIAYGDGGRPPKIPGGATLIFEVELLEIVKK